MFIVQQSEKKSNNGIAMHHSAEQLIRKLHRNSCAPQKNPHRYFLMGSLRTKKTELT